MCWAQGCRFLARVWNQRSREHELSAASRVYDSSCKTFLRAHGEEGQIQRSDLDSMQSPQAFCEAVLEKYDLSLAARII